MRGAATGSYHNLHIGWRNSLLHDTPANCADFLGQNVLHALFVPPGPYPDGARDGTATPCIHKLNTLDCNRIIGPELRKYCGSTRRI